jgi:hypothetical protein
MKKTIQVFLMTAAITVLSVAPAFAGRNLSP